MTKPITLESVVEEFKETMCRPREGDGALMVYDPSATSITDFIHEKVSSLLISLEERVEGLKPVADLDVRDGRWMVELEEVKSLIHQLREGKE